MMCVREHAHGMMKGVKKMTTQKPAEKPAAKPATKPATKQEGGVTLKDLAADLGRDPKSVRAAIRRHKGGAQVGQGGRYHWDSKTDPEYKELIALLGKKS